MAESVSSPALARIRMVTPWFQVGFAGCMSHVSNGLCAVLAEASLLLTRMAGALLSKGPFIYCLPLRNTHQDSCDHQRLIGQCLRQVDVQGGGVHGQGSVRVPHPNLERRDVWYSTGSCRGPWPSGTWPALASTPTSTPPSSSQGSGVTWGLLTSRWPCRDFSRMRRV